MGCGASSSLTAAANGSPSRRRRGTTPATMTRQTRHSLDRTTARALELEFDMFLVSGDGERADPDQPDPVHGDAQPTRHLPDDAYHALSSPMELRRSLSRSSGAPLPRPRASLSTSRDHIVSETPGHTPTAAAVAAAGHDDAMRMHRGHGAHASSTSSAPSPPQRAMSGGPHHHHGGGRRRATLDNPLMLPAAAVGSPGADFNDLETDPGDDDTDASERRAANESSRTGGRTRPLIPHRSVASLVSASNFELLTSPNDVLTSRSLAFSTLDDDQDEPAADAPFSPGDVVMADIEGRSPGPSRSNSLSLETDELVRRASRARGDSIRTRSIVRPPTSRSSSRTSNYPHTHST